MSVSPLRGVLVGAGTLFIFTPAASAQFNQQWVRFQKDPAGLVTQTPLTNNTTETDVAWGDLDKDGWIDMAVARKEHFTSQGKRPNVLLMNENGVLTDRSALYASATLGTPIADQGFLTPTNDRDVVVADLDNDGWLDVVTATTRSDGDPKHIGHPRVYMNLGEDLAGNWLGLRFENARFPQFFNFQNGTPHNPSFCSVDAGDVTNDGFADLYFGDYGGFTADLDDRLCINNSTGFFADQSQARMTFQMLESAFGAAVKIRDMNGDGLKDVVKQTALFAPQYVSITYNRPTAPGNFQIFHDFHVGFAPYHIDVGELNNDGRLDMIFSDDGQDRFRLNTGNDPFGRAIWGPAKTYQFLAGGDQGFASNNLVADLNMDGWNDVLICNVDVDINNYGGRLNIYANLGTVPGADIEMREQREFNNDSGWIGVVGMTAADMRDCHDVAVFDSDNDGDNDIFLTRREGNEVWVNQTNPTFCQTNLGFGGPGTATLSVCGQPLWFGNTSLLTVLSNVPSTPVFLAIGTDQGALPIFGGTIVTDPFLLLVSGLFTDGAGRMRIPITSKGTAPDLVIQGLVFDPAQSEALALTNGVRVKFN